MFGCLGIYVGEKIVLILREKETNTADNGVWLATFPEHHESLRTKITSIRSLISFGPGPTSWQVIPAESDLFEEEALLACEMVLRNDPRIGKIPARKRPKVKKEKTKAKPTAKKKRRSPKDESSRSRSRSS